MKFSDSKKSKGVISPKKATVFCFLKFCGIINKRKLNTESLSLEMLFYQGYVSAHKSAIHDCGFQLVEHLPYLTDLAPSDSNFYEEGIHSSTTP